MQEKIEGAARVPFREPCQKKSGKFATGIMKLEQAVAWTVLLLWSRPGQ